MLLAVLMSICAIKLLKRYAKYQIRSNHTDLPTSVISHHFEVLRLCCLPFAGLFRWLFRFDSGALEVYQSQSRISRNEHIKKRTFS